LNLAPLRARARGRRKHFFQEYLPWGVHHLDQLTVFDLEVRSQDFVPPKQLTESPF
jgi:hypothetical protein